MTIRVLDAAQDELEEAIYYYDERQYGLGLNFAEEVEQASRTILKLGRDYQSGYAVVWSIDFRTASSTKFEMKS